MKRSLIASICFTGAALLGIGFGSMPARAEDPVTIAVYAGVAADHWRKGVAEPFEAETGIPARIYDPTIPAAAIAASAGQPDFQLGLVPGYSVADLIEKGKLEPIDPAHLPNLKAIPERLVPKAPDGKFYAVPVYFSFLGIAYNTDLAKAEDFKSWKSLVDPKWKGKFAIGTAPFIAAYDLTLFALLNGGNEKDITPGIPMLKEVIANAGTVYTSMATLEAQLSRGEVVFAPFYANQIILQQRAGVKNIDIVRPDEGGLILPYYLVIPKGANNVANAEKLLNAILTPPYQGRLSEGGNWPVNPETKLPPELARELGGSTDEALANNFQPDWYVVGTLRTDRTHEVQDLMGQ
ncbi:ABC transporter substrate-binding protein [Rhodoligotrophos ferricapiens]|uniref:ABC transporter substrate-binding protein n=1 Tax=Rhodoligotrophos ferricapiens TaxID=3069264 RepID=UPI00315CAFB8